jgi:hypothetical protein
LPFRETLIIVLAVAMVATFVAGQWFFFFARPRQAVSLDRLIWALFAMLAETAALILVLTTV